MGGEKMTDEGPGVVAIVDDDDAVRASLAWYLEGVGHRVLAFSSAEAFIEAYEHLSPGCVILDIKMPGMSGLGFLEAHGEGLDLAVIVFTGHADVKSAVRAMQLGAWDLMEKPADLEHLAEKVHRGIVWSKRRHRRRVRRAQREALMATLTPREREVLDRLMRGQINKEVAWELHISPRTVEVHRAKVMKKLGVSSLVEVGRVVGEWFSGERDAPRTESG